jgi:hypothetical protein
MADRAARIDSKEATQLAGFSFATAEIRWDEKAGLRRDAVRSQVIDVLEAQIKRRPAMKKVSTAVAKQSRNISQQKLTIGLDLGDRNSWYCVVDEAGQVRLEQRVRTSAKALREVFGGMPRSRIALEIGTHSPWISRLLRELGHEVIVANARKVRLIGESRKKDDRLDAQPLAQPSTSMSFYSSIGITDWSQTKVIRHPIMIP